MLPLSEVHALASMLAEDVNPSYLDEEVDLVAEITGLPVEYREGTCKNVLTIGKQWVIKYTNPYGRVENSDESEEAFLTALEQEQPDLVRYFLKSHRVTESWTIQEYVQIDEDWYDDVCSDVEDVCSQAGVGDVFWKNVGYRRDGTWVIFDFDA